MAKKPRTDRPRRRSFSPAEKLRLLAGYETATESGTGNAFLRENGLYSSLISEWRRTRDAGLLTGKPAGAVVGRPTTDQAEIARLRRQLDVADAAGAGWCCSLPDRVRRSQGCRHHAHQPARDSQTRKYAMGPTP